ncbi:MAG: hypothetical protein EOS07_22005 [Mesorhizobium sp.]|nr:MAG: hypothetical protein EOS07_22005 [Mesorhizobium sp.]
MLPQQRRLARAALGLPNAERTSYRNKHYTSGKGDYHDAWVALQLHGLAVLGTDDGLAVFRLTRAGARLALEASEKVREADFLGVADA